MDKQYCKLIMVDGVDNANKYYEMIYESGNDFTVNYGRVEQSTITIKKPYSKWKSIYNSKIRKGYKDITELVKVTITEQASKSSTLKDILNKKVKYFLDLMKFYTDNLVDKTYSVKADKVSKKQVEQAQLLIDELNDLSKDATKYESEINIKLIDLYTTIPRNIKNVRNNILPHIDINKTLEQEQDNLDALSSQVKMSKDEELVSPSEIPVNETDEEKTILDVLGVTMEEVKVNSEIEYIVKQLSNRKIESIYQITKPFEESRFDKMLSNKSNKSTRLLIHGTRCTSVIPIIQQGLKIRPSGNYKFSGKAYGEGNYFSEIASKSLNYTGNDNDKIFIIYEVHTGNPFVYEGWYRGNSFTLNYKELKNRGYDSTYVKAGNGLLNSEIISYNEDQCRIKYIIHLK